MTKTYQVLILNKLLVKITGITQPSAAIYSYIFMIIISELKLPASSQDLLIPDDHILKACSVYEVLRHYSILLRLSPFRFEDFCAALSSEDQSNLLSEIHIALLKSIIRAEEKDGVQFGPLDYKDSINSIIYFMDSFTWPESLKLYLFNDPVAYALPLEIFDRKVIKTFIDSTTYVPCHVPLYLFVMYGRPSYKLLSIQR